MPDTLPVPAANNPQELELSATTPMEMGQAQSSLIAWCAAKIESLKAQADELQKEWAIAVKNKWRSGGLKRHADLAIKRVSFYEKIKAALEAGFCIVPNFPVSLFAIRTDKEKPKAQYMTTQYHPGTRPFENEAKMLPAGEGEYKNPRPETETHQSSQKEGKPQYETWTVGWQPDIDFPITMAKLKVMEATSRAIALKVFDQLGILPAERPKGDPLIVGEILDPRPTGYGPQKRVTFIIAWHLNVRDL